LIVAGRGRYEDPWHDHAGTSHSIALLLADEGLSTTVRGLFLDAVDDLESFDLFSADHAPWSWTFGRT
jgi:hypothetical protein